MISDRGKICYLIGRPLSHSMSPAIHGIIYSRMGLDWRYLLKEIETPEKIKDFASAVRESERCPGFNVTLPYKSSIMKYLDGTDPSAVKTGAVNTVVKNKNKLKGFNTDWEGFRDDLKLSLGISSAPESALILGAGGAARAAVYTLTYGFTSVPEQIFIYDIDYDKADSLKNDFRDASVEVLKGSGLKEKISAVDVLINSTPVGMNPASPPVDLGITQTKEALRVYDMVYNRKTELLQQADKKALRYASGAGMLARQGARAFELWSGTKVSEAVKKEMTEYVINAAAAAEAR